MSDSVFISEYDYAIGCCMWAVMIVSVVGNAVSLYVFWNLAKNRATILFICVAVTDLLMSLIATPYVAMNLFATRRISFTEGSELGAVYGSAVGIFHNTCSRVSIYTMLLLSLVRCAHMYYPLQIRQYTSTNSTITIVIIIWVICTTISFFPFMFNTKYMYNPWALLYVWRIEDLFDQEEGKTAAFKATYFFVLIFPFVIPGIGIIISTGIIIPKVYMSHKMSENMGFGQNVTQNKGDPSKSISTQCRKKFLIEPTKTILMIIATFLFCYIPLWCILTLNFLVKIGLVPAEIMSSIIQSTGYGYLLTVAYTIMTCTNSAFNPFIFYFRGADFQAQIRSLLGRLPARPRRRTMGLGSHLKSRLTLKTHLTSIQTETTSRQGPESPEVKGWFWKRCYKLRGSAATFEEPCVNMLSLTQPGTVTPATQGEPSSGGRLSEVL